MNLLTREEDCALTSQAREGQIRPETSNRKESRRPLKDPSNARDKSYPNAKTGKVEKRGGCHRSCQKGGKKKR